jgi:hypothetical protein
LTALVEPAVELLAEREMKENLMQFSQIDYTGDTVEEHG